MIAKLSGAVALVVLIVSFVGCSGVSKPAPVSTSVGARDAAVLYVPPPGAARAEGVPAALETLPAPGSGDRQRCDLAA